MNHALTAQALIREGDAVTYLGYAATVVHGYDPSDPWLPPASQRRPAAVSIRFDAPVRGMSRQMDVLASAVLPVTCLSTEPTLTLPTFTLFSQAGGFVLSAHVLEERVAQKVEDWERAGEIVHVAADLTPEPYAGAGVGITDTCGLCRKPFDLMYPPEQYPTVTAMPGDPAELVCDACQDEMDAAR